MPVVKEWSLTTGRGGGGYKMGNVRVRNFLFPPPQDRVKPLAEPF